MAAEDCSKAAAPSDEARTVESLPLLSKIKTFFTSKIKPMIMQTMQQTLSDTRQAIVL